ncbi:hypothetical protein NIES2104_15460 [Leptolyngbya sp. NIES-2104]|nr:hypothetical protein NIES2104_15460 [Leptolyngbya sp. NIES-2104]
MTGVPAGAGGKTGDEIGEGAGRAEVKTPERIARNAAAADAIAARAAIARKATSRRLYLSSISLYLSLDLS